MSKHRRSSLLWASAALLASAPAAMAGVFVGPNAGSVAGITYNVENVNPAGGAIYGPNGDLQNIAGLPGAGAGYGSLGAPVAAVSAPGGGIAAPAAPLGAFGAFQPPVPGVGFGDTFGGSANLFSSTFGGGAGAGIFWNNPTFIWDSGANGRASGNFSRGIATFTDIGGDAGKIPGVGLAISGTLGGQGPAGAFVAASLLGNFSIFNAAGGLVNSFSTSVAIVSDGPGARNDFVTRTPSVGGDAFFSAFLFPGANTFFAYGVDLLPAVAIPAGGTVRLDGTLSLVADPDATLTIDLIPLDVPLPDIGVLASSPIPEPASLGLLALAGLALAACRRKESRGLLEAEPG